MKRNGWKIGIKIASMLIALTALSIGPRPQPAAAGGAYSYNFEESLKPWSAGANSNLTLSHADNLCPMEPGTGMALVTRKVVGTAYMRASFPANTGDGVVVDWATKKIGRAHV